MALTHDLAELLQKTEDEIALVVAVGTKANQLNKTICSLHAELDQLEHNRQMLGQHAMRIVSSGIAPPREKPVLGPQLTDLISESKRRMFPPNSGVLN